MLFLNSLNVYVAIVATCIFVLCEFLHYMIMQDEKRRPPRRAASVKAEKRIKEIYKMYERKKINEWSKMTVQYCI